MLLYFIVSKQYSGKTIKDFLLKHGISHRLLLTLKKENSIYCNEIHVFTNHIIKYMDNIKIDLDYEESSDNIVPTKINLDIIYEDNAFLILNKPSGIPVHPSYNYYSTSLSNGVKYYFNKIGLKKKIRPVNRLDKDTSGIVIFAKNEYIQESLIKQMETKQLEKEYIAAVSGVLNEKISTIDAPIARKEKSIIERQVIYNGERAITHYKVLDELNDYSIVLFSLETGRTHQIRVHSAFIGHPILGDTLYGKESNLINRQALHAYKFQFIHPITKETVCFTAPLPDDMSFIKEQIYKPGSV